MGLLTEHVLNLTDPLGILNSLEYEEEDEEERGLGIEELAQLALKQCSGAASTKRKNPSDILGRLHALVDVLYRTPKIKLKYEPFEWVYEGLSPLLLDKVLRKRKGTPAALAIAATAIGRRVNIPLLPMPAAGIEAGAGQDPDAAIPVENLPPELQQRVSSSTQAAAPGPGQWLLKLFDNSSSGTSSTSNVLTNISENISNTNDTVEEIEDLGLYLDPSNGAILSSLEVKERFPAVGHLSPAEWQQQSVLRTWQGLSRIAMQAHQRRGESDFVAHWMFICLALDPSAPEWKRALAAPEVK
jgi:Transglutaminase-like superfamily